MDNQTFIRNIDELQALLTQNQEVGIIIGRNQNIDKMAAALSLYLSLTDAGRNVQIISTQEPIVELSNLVGVDKIKKSFSGLTKTLVVSVPYREGEVEKVSYNTDNGRMNFNIIAGESGIHPFDLSEIQIISQGSAPQVVITVGVPQEQELRELVDPASQIKIVNIDIDAQNTKYGQVTFVDSGFSSLSEIVAVVLQELALPVQVDTAQNLMDGVLSATKNFSDSKTSSFAFEAAAILLRQGARRAAMSQVQTQQHAQIQQPRNQNQGHQQNNQQKQNRQEHIPQPQYNSGAVENKESKPMSDENLGDPQDIPSDWFVPKVFKGSKKPGQ